MSFDFLVKSFLQGIGIVALAALLYEYVLHRLHSERTRNVAIGAILACGAVASMSMPFEIRDGIIVDLRHIFLVLAATLGGPPAAIISAGATAGFRLYVGGAGLAAGLIGILISMFAGLLLAHIFRASKLTAHVLVIYGLAASLSLLSMFVLPIEIVVVLLDNNAVPFVTANLVGVVIAGQMLQQKNGA